MTAPIEDNEDHYSNEKFRQRVRKTAGIEDSELREQIQSALHRIRTRSLRGAPVYLSHVNLAEHELMQLLNAHTAPKDTEARLDEAESVYGLGIDQYLAHIAELEQKISNNNAAGDLSDAVGRASSGREALRKLEGLNEG